MNARWWWVVASVCALASGVGGVGLAATAWAAEEAAEARPSHAPEPDAAPTEHVDTSDTGDYATP